MHHQRQTDEGALRVVTQDTERRIGLRVEVEGALTVGMGTFRRCFENNNAAQLPRGGRIPIILSTEGELVPVKETWHQHDLLTFIGPIVFMQIADKEEWRLLLNKHVVTASTHTG